MLLIFDGGWAPRRVLVEFRMIANVLQHGENFEILQISFRDLLGFPVMIKIAQTELPAFAGHRKLPIKWGHVEFVAELETRQFDIVRLEFGEERREVRSELIWVGQ